MVSMPPPTHTQAFIGDMGGAGMGGMGGMGGIVESRGEEVGVLGALCCGISRGSRARLVRIQRENDEGCSLSETTLAWMDRTLTRLTVLSDWAGVWLQRQAAVQGAKRPSRSTGPEGSGGSGGVAEMAWQGVAAEAYSRSEALAR